MVWATCVNLMLLVLLLVLSSPIRLSDRVAYEQCLADTHLHSTVSKESLGQACHQYLIQPLAKTFTNAGKITIGTFGHH